MSTTGLKDAPCTAKIRPFPDDTELICLLDEHGPDMKHVSVLENYAYPGSSTEINWFEHDRRNFRGEWVRCTHMRALGDICVLPVHHLGPHAH